MNENEVYNLQLKIKFTLEKTWTRQQILAENGATETDAGDRETMPWHQGGAVVPANDETSHKEIRPETHY